MARCLRYVRLPSLLLLLLLVMVRVTAQEQAPTDATTVLSDGAGTPPTIPEPVAAPSPSSLPNAAADAAAPAEGAVSNPSATEASSIASLLTPVPIFDPNTKSETEAAPVPAESAPAVPETIPAVEQKPTAETPQPPQQLSEPTKQPAAVTEVVSPPVAVPEHVQAESSITPVVPPVTEAAQPPVTNAPVPVPAEERPARLSLRERAARDHHRGAGAAGFAAELRRQAADRHARPGHEGHGHQTDPQTTLIKHGGHSHTVEDAERHGGLIFGTTVGVMFAAQIGLFLWKKYHVSSFDRATVVGLWLFPALYCFWHGAFVYWRLLTLWATFTVATAFIIRRALAKPMARQTPRQVYAFFFWSYCISYATAVGGYVIIMIHFMGLGFIPLIPSPSSALLLLFYGLYFGVLGRDLANVTSQSMALSMGYVAKKGEMPRKEVPPNVCAICDMELIKSFRPQALAAAAAAANGRDTTTGTEGEEKDGGADHLHVLNCGHQFHDFCLRGWTMIGKRDTCANCNEKVQLRSSSSGKLSKSPWEKTSVAWAFLLDLLRYLLVFNPVVVVAAQFALYVIY